MSRSWSIGTRIATTSTLGAGAKRQRGLNENYARELMELHSLGVDREYTQRDVTELARVFTGWTARWNNGGEGDGEYGFYFNAGVHDTNNKDVLGSRLKGGGEEQGITVIRALAKHKYTLTLSRESSPGIY